MTQEELDALPECGGIGYEDLGNGLKRPVVMENFALYQPPDEPMMVTDQRGDSWEIGYAHGQRWKRRMPR